MGVLRAGRAGTAGEFVERVRGRFRTDPVSTQFGLGPAEEGPAPALVMGADPAGVVGAAHEELRPGATWRLLGHDISALAADMRSPAHTNGIREARGR
jgi:hypothetical protein